MKELITHVIAVLLGIVIASAVFALIWPSKESQPGMQMPAPMDQPMLGENQGGPSMLGPGQGMNPPIMDGQPSPEMNPGMGAMHPKPNETGAPDMKDSPTVPEVFSGLLYFEEKHPDLKIKSDQCRNILPTLDAIGDVWGQTHSIGRKLQHLLTPEQQQFILDHQKEYQTAEGKSKALESLGKAGEIMKDVIGSMTQLCHTRSAEGGGDADYEKAEVKTPVDYMIIATGIIHMENNPSLRITSAQARKMGPYFNVLAGLNTTVNTGFQTVLFNLSDEQIQAMTKERSKIMKMADALGKKGSDAGDKDPLIEKVKVICKERM